MIRHFPIQRSLIKTITINNFRRFSIRNCKSFECKILKFPRSSIQQHFYCTNSSKSSLKPKKITLKKQEKALYIQWEEGNEVKYPAEFLRINDPSVHRVGHDGKKRVK